MKTIKIKKILLPGIIFMMAVLFSGLQAQTVIEIYDQIENSIIVKFESNKKINKPEKIILIFDDDVVTFKETDEKKLSNQEDDIKSSLTSESLESVLEVESEKEIEIEDWMLRPFTLEYTYSFLFPDEEEDIKLEDWMLDLSKWD